MIYTVIPASAFRVKSPVDGLKETAEAVAEAVNLLVPLSIPEKKLGSIHYLFAVQMAVRTPAGAFEEKTVNNRLYYAKYLDLNNIVVACQ